MSLLFASLKHMITLVATFSIETVITVVSLVSEDQFNENFQALRSAYHLLNFVSMAMVLSVFARVVEAARERFTTSNTVRRKCGHDKTSNNVTK